MRRLVLAAMLALTAGCPAHRPPEPREDEAIRVARTAFDRLAAGDPEAAELFDFPALRGAVVDTGASYRVIPDDASRAAFRLSFVKALGDSLRAANIRATGWVLEKRDGAVAVAAASLGDRRVHVTVLRGRVISVVRDPR